MPFDGDVKLHEPKVVTPSGVGEVVDYSTLVPWPTKPRDDKRQRAYDAIMKAAALIEDGKHWMRGSFAGIAQDTYRIPVAMNDVRADAFCAVGALMKMGLSSAQAAEIDLHVARLTGRSLMEINDTNATPMSAVSVMRACALDVFRGRLVL
jgi:hypothetical protein